MRIGHTILVWPITCLAVVLIVLIAVLIVVLVLAVLVIILIVVLLLILVLVFHFYILQVFVLRLSRYSSIPRISGFILRLKNQADQKTAEYGCGDAAGCCFQAAGEDTEKTAFVYSFPDAFCQTIAETCQGNRCAGTGKIYKLLIQTDSAQEYADHHIADKDPCRCQLCFVNQNLTRNAQ